MPFNELTPRAAADLAEGIYAVNGPDEKALKAFLSRPYFKPESTSKKILTASVGGRVLRAAKDAFGVVATGQGQFAGDLFLIFRGTTEANNKADFITDARIGITSSSAGFPVHIGFQHAFSSMTKDIRQFVSDLSIPDTVHCIGHSLGGAVATLASEWVYSNLSKNVKLYTFGQPRVGMTLFSHSITRKLGAGNIYRAFNTTDPVPMVPIFPYVHSPLPGNGYCLASEQMIASGQAHSINFYGAQVKGKRWSDLNSTAAVYNLEYGIKEWLSSRLHEKFDCPKTFQWLEKALLWLIAKCFATVISVAQLAVMGVHTFLDKLAWLLAKGYEWADESGKIIKLFIKKLMRILGIPKHQMGTKPRQSFLRFLLRELARRANELAQKAIRSIR